MILVTGPTGSGKSTTLYATMNKLNSESVNIMTVEDPVEYQISGLNQVQANEKAGLTFASALRSFLRQDPDIILVGEIRDSETATIAIEAALTGHLVLSTLHTNDAAGAVTRLTEMGIEPFLCASSVICVQAQRLARMICPNCKEAYTPPMESVKQFGLAALPTLTSLSTVAKAVNTVKIQDTREEWVYLNF
jgi:type IV pilus assembly protein PilB